MYIFTTFKQPDYDDLGVPKDWGILILCDKDFWEEHKYLGESETEETPVEELLSELDLEAERLQENVFLVANKTPEEITQVLQNNSLFITDSSFTESITAEAMF